MMAKNEILDEIYATREALLAEHGGDLHAYVEAARKRALDSGREVAVPKQRTKHCAGAPNGDRLEDDSVPAPPVDL